MGEVTDWSIHLIWLLHAVVRQVGECFANGKVEHMCQ